MQNINNLDTNIPEGPRIEEKEEVPTKDYQQRYKWLFLVMAAVFELGFMYNNMSIMCLQTPLQQEFDLNDFKYAQILMFQNLPGIFSPIISGFLADRYGSALIFTLGLIINYAGQFLSTYAVAYSNFWVLILGQLLLAAGAQTLVITKNKMFKSWFTNKQMGKAVSFCMIVDTAGILLCDIGYPHLNEANKTLWLPFVVGSGILIGGLPFGIVQIVLHKRLLRHQRKENEETFEESLSCRGSFRAIKKFPKTFWLLLVYSVTSFLSFFCTKSFTTRYLITQFNLTIGETGLMLAVSMIISGVGTVIAGIVLDKYGKLPLAGVFGSLLITIGIIINMVLPRCDKCVTGGVPLAIMSLGAVINQLVPILITMRIVQGPSMGVALGFSAFLTSAMMMFFPILEGRISDKTFEDSGYFWVFFLNAGLSLISCLVALAIFIIDYRGPKKLHGVLPPPPTRRITSRRSTTATLMNGDDAHIHFDEHVSTKKVEEPTNQKEADEPAEAKKKEDDDNAQANPTKTEDIEIQA